MRLISAAPRLAMTTVLGRIILTEGKRPDLFVCPLVEGRCDEDSERRDHGAHGATGDSGGRRNQTNRCFMAARPARAFPVVFRLFFFNL